MRTFLVFVGIAVQWEKGPKMWWLWDRAGTVPWLPPKVCIPEIIIGATCHLGEMDRRKSMNRGKIGHLQNANVRGDIRHELIHFGSILCWSSCSREPVGRQKGYGGHIHTKVCVCFRQY